MWLRTSLIAVWAACIVILLGATPDPEHTASARTARDGADTDATRLVHGPIVFRILPRSRDGDARYEMFFKLTRDPLDREAVDLNVISSRGTFGLIGPGRQGSTEFVFRNGKPLDGTGACIVVTYFDGGTEPTLLRRLDRIPVGARVRARLQPLTRAPGRDDSVFGQTYISYPRMQVSDARYKDAKARREFKRIGCPRGGG